MGTTSWQIGSHPSVGACTVNVNRNGANAEDLTILSSTSELYLYDNGSAFDALLKLRTAIRGYTQEDISGTLVYLTRDRKVKVEFLDGGGGTVSNHRINSFSGTGATDFKTLLGIENTDLGTYAATMTAAKTSPYLWSANKVETPLLARRGKTGAPYHDTAVGMSGTRIVVATTNNSGKINDYRWERVLNARYWSTSEAWGEYYVWWDYVQRRFRKFKIWQEVNELDASTSAATIGPALGPYVYRWDGQSPLSFPFSRDIDFLEYLHTVEIPCVEVDEYT